MSILREEFGLHKIRAWSATCKAMVEPGAMPFNMILVFR